MRDILITATVVWVLSTTGMYIWHTNTDAAARVAPPATVTAGVDDTRVGELALALSKFQQTSSGRLQDMAATQSTLTANLALLNEQLQDLSARLMEATAVAQARDAEAADAAAQPSPDPRSEAIVSEHLDASFDNGDWDIEETELARSRTNAIVAKLPGVNLADMVCNDGVCRATFTKLDGSAPDIGGVWGEPPFMNEGFTMHNDDGSVELYFARTGVSLDEVRERLVASQ